MGDDVFGERIRVTASMSFDDHVYGYFPDYNNFHHNMSTPDAAATAKTSLSVTPYVLLSLLLGINLGFWLTIDLDMLYLLHIPDYMTTLLSTFVSLVIMFIMFIMIYLLCF